MRRLWLLVLWCAPLSFTARASDVPARGDASAGKLGNVYVVAIGQEDGWKFLPEGFERVVRDQGKGLYRAFHSRVLTGNKATRKELFAGLAWVGEKAKEGDLVMLFIACHGSCTAGGESVFATRDGPVRPREVKSLLGKLPCHAIVVNDACCSGNWPKELPGDPMPPNVTALCCCLSTQVSGIEFDITLFEALYGKADFNRDGLVDLDEVIKYCGLRIKEVQGGKLTPVMQKAKNLKGNPVLTRANPELVGVVHKGEVFSALVEKQDGDTYHVRVIGFNDRPGPFSIPRTFARDDLLLPKDGAALMVEKDGAWLPARLVGREKEGYRVRYLGPKGAEEVVPAERVRHLFAGNPGEAFPPGLFNKRQGKGQLGPLTRNRMGTGGIELSSHDRVRRGHWHERWSLHKQLAVHHHPVPRERA
jgi:hypothetical protein